ncbi:DUF2797 domain-containing protein [Frankia sp. Cr1]|uniref:DUF2797 domain-containing protein n=1 Tax=Frankia sp. Cr1 TaxID=3073931 RepID=UPI002AD4B959|nr:DUF2797 domain-containing protein [Frankia sp. Cr1]
MTEQPTGWRATGLYWTGGIPGFGLADQAGSEREQPAHPGATLSYGLAGERRCIGIWQAADRRRRCCPFSQPLPAQASSAQCAACAAVDPGRAFSRSSTPDDDRTYRLYLAWFGVGLLKVGLTATARDTDRLAEQGAIAFTWLGHGRLQAVRAAERAVAASGLAPDRRQRRTKIAAWWSLPVADERRRDLEAAHRAIHTAVSWPAGLTLAPAAVVDRVAVFGLDRVPVSCQEVIGLHLGSVINGTVRCVAGRDLILDTVHGPVLLDARLLAGWAVHPTDAVIGGLDLRSCHHVRRDDAAEQHVLF